MAYRNKIFVSFDGDNDIRYYRLMKAWKQSDYSDFSFHDAHDLNVARDTSSEQTIKRRLRVRLLNSKIVVSLIGSQTRYLYKFVRWELEQAVVLGLPIIGVNLNKKRSLDNDRCPPVIRDQLAIHISFNSKILQYALQDWPHRHRELKKRGESDAYYYTDSVYQELNL